jgi:hypothetical protein
MRLSIASVCLALSLMPLAGCNLFRPEAPEPPGLGGGTTTIPKDYSAPDQTLQTMANAMALKNQGNGGDAWIGAFADPGTDSRTATFGFDPTVLAANNTSDPGWDLVHERKFYGDMSLVRTQRYFMSWSAWEPGGDDKYDAAADTAHLERIYKIYILDANNNTSGAPIAIGVAKLSFMKTTTLQWVIFRWMDFVDTKDADPNDHDQLSFSQRRLDSL